MKMKNILFLFLSILCFTACQKEDDNGIPIPAPDCLLGLDHFTEAAVEIPDSSMRDSCMWCVFDCMEIYSDAIPYDYFYPCFNPRNPDQLAYYRYDNTEFNSTYELWVADFCTGEKKMIAGNAFYGIDWSVKDWIIYTASDQNIWKIKSNGDSLTQLTFEGSYNRYPKWSPEGNKIAYKVELNGENRFLIADENGEAIDTIPELKTAGAWCWVGGNKIFYGVGHFNGTYTKSIKKLFDITTSTETTLHELELRPNNDSLIMNTYYLPHDNSVVWAARGFVGKTDLATGTFQSLKASLYHETYLWLAVRPGEGELLFNKRASYYVDNCMFDSELDFILINADGSNPRKVLLE